MCLGKASNFLNLIKILAADLLPKVPSAGRTWKHVVGSLCKGTSMLVGEGRWLKMVITWEGKTRNGRNPKISAMRDVVVVKQAHSPSWIPTLLLNESHPCQPCHVLDFKIYLNFETPPHPDFLKTWVFGLKKWIFTHPNGAFLCTR